MTRKLIAISRIKYNGTHYEPGNSFICESDNEAQHLIDTKVAKPYPDPTEAALARMSEEAQKKAKIEAYEARRRNGSAAIYPRTKQAKTGVTIVTAIKDNLYYLETCVKSVYRNTKKPFEFIIIDNGSGKEVKNYLIKLQGQKKNLRIVTNDKNMYYAYACNQGIKLAQYDYICMLDADTYVSPGWLTGMMAAFDRFEDCGIVVPSQAANTGACYIKFKLKNEKYIGREISAFQKTLKPEYLQKQIFEVYGFCHLVKREVYDQIGVYDWRRYWQMASNETDLFWRAGLKGFEIYWAKGTYVHHFHNRIKIALGFNPSKMCNRGHEEFRKRQQHPEKYYVGNDVEIKENINQAYQYNKTYQELKPYFNE